MNSEYFSFDELIKKRYELGNPYFRFVEDDKWSAGLYYLPKDGVDEQSPHRLDEVYYVIKGKSKFVSGNNETIIRPGSILFVKAEVDHRFYDIQEDLQVLVIFTKQNSNDASDSFYATDTERRSLIEIEKLSVFITEKMDQVDFTVILSGSGKINASQSGFLEIDRPGVVYNPKLSDISVEEQNQPFRILAVKSKN